MKSRYFLLFSGLAALFTAGCHAPSPAPAGPLSLSPDRLQAGTTGSFDYKPDSAFAADTGALEGTLFYAVKKNIYASGLALMKNGDHWKGSFALPDSADAFAFRFVKGENADDNKGNGFIFPVFNKDQKPVQNAYAGEAGFYGGLGGYVLRLKTRPDTVLALMEKEFAAYPDSRREWEINYLNDLLQAKKDSAQPQITEQLGQLLAGKDVPEDSWMQAYSLYNRMKMTTTADSLAKIIRERFPKGMLAMEDVEQEFLKMKQADSMSALLQQFRVEYPVTDIKSPASSIYSYMLSRLMQQYADAGRLEEMKTFMHYAASEASSKSSLAMAYNNIAWEWAQKDKNMPLADSLSKASLALVNQGMSNDIGKPSYMTHDEWQKMQEGNYGMYADTYAFILAKNGNYGDALNYEEKAIADSHGNESPDMNERYTLYLEKTGDTGKAKLALEGFIKDGQGTENMKSQLKGIYVKQNGNNKGYDTYLAGLEAAAREKMKADLAKEMISEPAAGFSLPDMKGMQVALNDLKGKVVVVDFWATWCGPCKASFPGMQKTLDNFKNDSSVQFLFVDTWESTPPDVRQKQVADFIKQHKYGFHVLLDRNDPDNKGQYLTVNAYKVDGIPTKFVLDKKGNIRFKEIGFDGNTDKLVKKLSMMINMAKEGD